MLRKGYALLVWLGRSCEKTFLALFHGIIGIGRTLLQFFKDFLHGCSRVFRLCKRYLLDMIQQTKEMTKAMHAMWRGSEGKSRFARCRAVLSMIGTMIFSEHGIVTSVFRFVVPLMCCAFLFSIVTYAANLNYGIAVTFNGKLLGYIDNESEYLAAEQIVHRRLSYTEENYDISFQRKLRLELQKNDDTLLTAGELADAMLRSASISLVDGTGIYVNDNFYGVVTDPEPIREALSHQLSQFSRTLPDDAEDIQYADTIRYEKGTYLADNLVPAQKLAKKLTEEKHQIRAYTTKKGDTIYSVAEHFSTTVERLLYLNQDLDRDTPLLEVGTFVTVPITSHLLPILYTRTVTEPSFIDYDSVEIETPLLNSGQTEILTHGKKGEKENTVSVTYTDGTESSRHILASRMISEPVNEEIGVGIYAAQPSDASLQIAGSGRFSWPVNGGYISDTFISNRNHRGIDIAVPMMTEIYAAADGVVRVAELHSSYGNYIILDHQDSYETVYAHASLLLVQVGQEVKRGQIIALAGSTGNSTGSHLHFEVRINGVNYDPMAFLRVHVD